MKEFSQLEKILNYSFSNKALLSQSLTHKSFYMELGGSSSTDLHGFNERLEFLGDAVIDLLVSALLMERYPLDSEGELSRKRAGLVNEKSLAQVALHFKLDEYLRLGKSEVLGGGTKKPRLLSSAFEALIGAIYLDSGEAAPKRVFADYFFHLIDSNQFTLDFKTNLQEICQHKWKLTPVYEVIEESGPSHAKWFKVVVKAGERTLAQGEGLQKKMAEQQAAELALSVINEEELHV